MNQAQKETILKRQLESWDRSLVEARKGNPFATLCLHCYGRHAPPNDEICPREPPQSVR